MPLVVRKIEYAKWSQRDILNGQSVSADAITSLKTTRNTLSLWVIKNSLELEEAVLAIVSNFQGLSTIDVLVIETSDLDDNGLKTKDSPGITNYGPFADRHRDIINLEYKSLGTVANVIVESIKRSYKTRFKRGEIKQMLYDAINKGMIDRNDLDEGLLKDLYPPKS